MKLERREHTQYLTRASESGQRWWSTSESPHTLAPAENKPTSTAHDKSDRIEEAESTQQPAWPRSVFRVKESLRNRIRVRRQFQRVPPYDREALSNADLNRKEIRMRDNRGEGGSPSLRPGSEGPPASAYLRPPNGKEPEVRLRARETLIRIVSSVYKQLDIVQQEPNSESKFAALGKLLQLAGSRRNSLVLLT